MGAHPDFEARLTPAAREALQELLDDYRNQILLAARDSAARVADAREVSVYDLMNGLNRIQVARKFENRDALSRILYVYILTGAATGLGGVAAFSYRQILRGHTLNEQLPLLIALSGFVIAVMSFIFLRLRSTRPFYPKYRMISEEPLAGYIGSFVTQWRDLELALREAAATKLGESAAAVPIRVLVDRMVHQGLLPEDDSQRVSELLKLRNWILHEGRRVGQTELDAAARTAQRITERLRSLSLITS